MISYAAYRGFVDEVAQRAGTETTRPAEFMFMTSQSRSPIKRIFCCFIVFVIKGEFYRNNKT